MQKETELKLGACYLVLKELVQILSPEQHAILESKISNKVNAMMGSDGADSVDVAILHNYINSLLRQY
ncbi:sigma-S stabilization anti-adapter protein IraP [Edwardsiella tarda]|uniref:sigma-S stabilization anti-adapter protein IraP n=1 Tax=Edwardsiella tarda TaxID=636 RepID=UPI000BE37DA6|nr:sigma-S stabilization anti-adapter protein IraP [Edwardsiella tarda]ATI62824.1 hypothetical protein CPU03_00345 [Edwardsiella tarda]